MSNATDVNDFLLAGGVPAAKFAQIGDTVRGTVVSSVVTQQTDLKSGEPKLFKNGDQMMQVVITLQTDERDASIENDDGLRKLYVKSQMTAAVGKALRDAGAKLAVGGTLAVQFQSEIPSTTPGFNATKQYVAQYRPPAPSTEAANDLLNAGGPTPTAPAAAAPTADSLI